MNNLRSNIKTLRPLNGIAKLLAILPNFDEDQSYEFRHGYVYTICIVTLTIIISSITIYGKIVHLIDYMEVTVHFINVASEITLMATLFLSVLEINLCNGRNVCKLLQLLKGVDNAFQNEMVEYKSWIGFRAELIIGHLLFLAYYLYSLFIWLSMLDLNVAKFFILRDLEMYHLITLALVLRNYALVITYRFETLNKILVNIVNTTESIALVKLSRSPNSFNWNVKKLQKIFTDLSHAVTFYNKIFGWQFITLYAWAVTNILMAIDMILVYGKSGKLLLGAKFDISAFILCGLWTIVPLIVVLGVVMPCKSGSSTALSTADICYTLVNDLNDKGDCVDLKAELLEFASQATSRCPQFIAPGNCFLNYSVLFTLFGSVTTYLIVLIQFND